MTFNWSPVLFTLILGIESNQILDIAIDFTLLYNVKFCNFITCETDNLLLMKKTSENFRCMNIIKSSKIPISDWLIPGIMQLFIFDLDCPDSDIFLKQAEILGLFNDNVIWLLITGNKNWESLTIYPTVLSQVHLMIPIKDGEFKMIGLYRRDPSDRLIMEDLGYWTKNGGVVLSGVMLPSVRRMNTEGRIFRAAGVISDDDSLKHLYDLVNPQIDTPTKIHYTYWEHIIQGMNGRMEFIVTRDWGELMNGSFNGMIGYIQRNEAEIAVSPLYTSEDRLRYLRYLSIGHFFRIKFLFLSPPLSYKNNIYFLPFGNDVWYGCVALFVLSVILMRIVARNEDIQFSEVTRVRPLTSSWMDIVMLHFGTICQKDLYIEPKGICGRIIILHIKIFVLFIYVFYSASILVLLQSSDRSITTLKDLDESNFVVSSHDTPYNRFYFKMTTNPVGKSLVNKVTNGTGFIAVESGIKKVQDGFFAFNINTATGYLVVREMFTPTDCCRLQELEESLFPGGNPLMAVKRDLPYRELISIMFQKISERGFVKRESRRKSAEKPPCEQSRMSYADIGIVDSEGAFQLLIFAYFLSFLIFLGELQFYKRKERKIHQFFLQYGYHD